MSPLTERNLPKSEKIIAPAEVISNPAAFDKWIEGKTGEQFGKAGEIHQRAEGVREIARAKGNPVVQERAQEIIDSLDKFMDEAKEEVIKVHPDYKDPEKMATLRAKLEAKKAAAMRKEEIEEATKRGPEALQALFEGWAIEKKAAKLSAKERNNMIKMAETYEKRLEDPNTSEKDRAYYEKQIASYKKRLAA